MRYRDLLETAETIVQMNIEIKGVEKTIPDMGRRCNPGIIERKSKSIQELQSCHHTKCWFLPTSIRYCRAANTILRLASLPARAFHFNLLEQCTTAIARLLRKRSSVIVTAKLLVIARLLHKVVVDSEYGLRYVERLRKRRTSYGGILLERINRQIASPDSTTNDLVESLSAFCLATSSSAGDALRHFHSIRLKAIDHVLNEPMPIRHTIMPAFNLYMQTLQKTTDILTGPFTEILRKLTAHPLIQDPALKATGEARVEIYSNILPDEIENFIPWIKYDQNSKVDAEGLAKEWSKKAFKIFCIGARKVLANCHDFSEILRLRRDLFKSWLTGLSSTPSHSPLEVLEGLRRLINDRLESLLETQTEGLVSLGSDISKNILTLNETNIQTPGLSLWDPNFAFQDYSDGAEAFKSELVKRVLGNNATVQGVLIKYDAWLEFTQDRITQIVGLKSTRWEDYAEDDVDDDLVQTATTLLSEDDPRLLEERHRAALSQGYIEFENALKVSLKEKSDSSIAFKAVFLLRLIRGIQGNIPTGVSLHGKAFAADFVPKLHQIYASQVVSRISPSALVIGLDHSGRRCVGRQLWEGEPQLPMHPSATGWKLLQRLSLAMEQLGYDLWSPSAVSELKTQLTRKIISAANAALDKLQEMTESAENGAADGEQSDSSSSHTLEGEADTLRDHQKQLYFDLLYFGHALTVRHAGDTPESSLPEVAARLREAAGIDGDAVATLRKRAEEHWKRTQLLFGLLA